jgi:thiamine biosynthesis lipoprotein
MHEPTVFGVMGTILSLRADIDAAALGRVRAVFEDAEERFSLYRPASELSGIRNGTLHLPEASVELREMYALALDWRTATDGAFTPHRPDGVIDLDGVVKAWAMERAARELGTDWCLNVGGDVLVSGVQPDGAPWSLGIVDPFDRSGLLATVELAGRAAATSGSAERGEHIWTRSGAPAGFVQATVLADDIVTADVLATAIVSGGAATLDAVTSRFEVDALVVDRSGGLLATPGLRDQLVGALTGPAVR